MSDKLCKKIIRQISRDGGLHWEDLDPEVYKVGEVIEEPSNCDGALDLVRWIKYSIGDKNICKGNNLHYIEYEEVTNDGGITWRKTGNERVGEIYEENSPICEFPGDDYLMFRGSDTGDELNERVRINGEDIFLKDMICRHTSKDGNVYITKVPTLQDLNNMFGDDSIKHYWVNEQYIIKMPDTSNVTNMARMFNGHSTNYNYGHDYVISDGPYKPYRTFNTSNVTNMAGMFMYSTYWHELELSMWDTSKVITMRNMFYNCHIRRILLKGWNVSNVTDMSGMFEESQWSKYIDTSGWVTSNVTDMSYMFYHCGMLDSPEKGLDTSSWDTSKVTNMSHMFEECSLIDGLDVSGWDTSNVTDMSYMFWETERTIPNITYLDVSNWNVEKVTNMKLMFCGNRYLRTLDVSKWNPKNVTNMSAMFLNTSIQNMDCRNWNVSNVIDMGEMFEEASTRNGRIDCSNWNVTNVKNMREMFRHCAAKEIDLSGWEINPDCNTTGMLASINWTTPTILYARGCSDATVQKFIDGMSYDANPQKSNITIVR